MLKNLFFGCLLVFLVLQVVSQESEIDPRQYVYVLYNKNRIQGKLDTIWNWEMRKNVPNQKFRILDVDGELKINFDKVPLSKNKDFEGTFSLEAEISGANGTRRIEVSPYSEIGVQRIPIGIKSEPPSQITLKLLNIIRELRDVDSLNFFANVESQYQYLIADRERFLSAVSDVKALINSNRPLSEKEIADASDRLQTLYQYIMYIPKTEIKTLNSLKELIIRLSNSLDMDFRQVRNDLLTRSQYVLEYVVDKSAVVLDYFKSFEEAGSDALKAMLTLMGKDIVNYENLKKSIASRQDRLKGVLTLVSGNNAGRDSIYAANLREIAQSMNALYELAKFEGSILERVINEGPASTIQSYSSDTSYFGRMVSRRRNLINRLEANADTIAVTLTKITGQLLYKKLVYATIDLGKSGSKEGEVLTIYVTWMLNSKTDSLSNSPRLPIGKYYLRETGWKVEITDMFALIKRINEADVDQAKVSPTNFKGSGGAVLMWTYQKEDRGLQVTWDAAKNDFSVRKKNVFWNFLQPSIGLNVSYLDFTTEKDVEIGTGLQLGLFRNKIFFGYGVNLHMLSPRNQSPTYFYLGFSFAKLQDLFKGSGGISSRID
jgi:hypothetical protein